MKRSLLRHGVRRDRCWSARARTTCRARTAMSTAASTGGTSVRRATAPPRSPASRPIRWSTTPARRPAASGRPTDGGVHWDADLRRAAGVVDRRARRRAVRSEHRLGRHRRSVHPQQHLGRRRASTSRPTPARPGRSWGSSRPAASRGSSIHPTNPNVVLACALGPRLRAAAGARRVPHDRRRQDVGRVLFVDENTGCSDLAMDPNNPRILFAGHVAARDPHLGPRERRARQRPLHVARRRRDLDAAQGNGLPTKPVGKVAVAIARGESEPRLRADRDGRRRAVERQGDRRGQLWRSDDGGANWRIVSYDRNAWAARTTTPAWPSRPTTRTRPTS